MSFRYRRLSYKYNYSAQVKLVYLFQQIRRIDTYFFPKRPELGHVTLKNPDFTESYCLYGFGLIIISTIFKLGQMWLRENQ